MNKVWYASYKQACLAWGLAYNDKEWIEGLQDSALSKMTRAMRYPFTHILGFELPENLKSLLKTFKENLAEDFIREARLNGTTKQ